MLVAQNVRFIQGRISAAAMRIGRDPATISLMAVSKTLSATVIREAYDCGIRLFGESRVQEFEKKFQSLRDLPDACWHMIGHLQTNKTTKAVELFTAVDSVDSLRLAEKLNLAAARASKRLPVLIEVNVSGEASKTGIARDSPELDALLRAAPSLDHLEFQGLMTVPPFFDDPEQARPFFRRLRELRDDIHVRLVPSLSLKVLSMGMSHDFDVAIEEGATRVRIGTAIFGDRQQPL